MENSKQLNPLEHSDSKNKPSKINIGISKQDFWKKIKCPNQKDMNNDLNEIIYNNRKNKPKYLNLTESKIKATKYILISELKSFLQTNDLPVNLFD